MNGYKFKDGSPIPDDAFENDTGAPDPDKFDAMTSPDAKKARAEFVARTKAEAGKIKPEADTKESS